MLNFCVKMLHYYVPTDVIEILSQIRNVFGYRKRDVVQTHGHTIDWNIDVSAFSSEWKPTRQQRSY